MHRFLEAALTPAIAAVPGAFPIGIVRPDGGVLPQLRDIIDVVAHNAVWVGGPGVAMAMKVLQNGLGLVQLAAIAEVAAAGKGLRVDAALS